MDTLLQVLTSRSPANGEDGAVGALVIGVIVGAALVIFGIIKLVIPG